MAKFIQFDKKEYNFESLISLKKGDRWNLHAHILDSLGAEKSPVDLTNMSVTGFFPGATGAIAVLATIPSPLEGAVNFIVDSTLTVQMITAEEGSSMYAQIAASGDTEYITVETKFEPFKITNPVFRVF